MSIELTENKKEIIVKIPLTTPSGKTRVKERDNVFDYGIPFASRNNPFNQKNYVEWQIGYDAVIPNDIENFENAKYKNYVATTLKNKEFVGDNGKNKALYELSEYCHYFYRWGIFTESQLTELKKYLNDLGENDLLDRHKHCAIKRTHPKTETINDIEFHTLIIEYPQLVHKFGVYDIIAEITIREKQRAVGTQPMLYFCFPVTELQSETPLIGRIAKLKESADFVFNKDNAFIILEMIKIFGMLSSAHRFDTVAILDTIINHHDN